MTESQKMMLKNLALLGAFYFGAKSANKLIRYGVMAGLGYVIIKGHSQGTAMSGMGMKVDPHMAIDMLFPKMNDTHKSYAKLATSELLKGMFPVKNDTLQFTDLES